MSATEPTPLAYYPGVTPTNTDEERQARLAAANVPEQMWDYMGKFGVSPLAAKMGLVYHTMTVELLSASVPVAGNEQNMGIFHGGAHLVLAETLGSVATVMHAFTLGDETVTGVVGTEINASHTRAATEGRVLAECRPIRLGRNLCTHEIVMSDDQGRRLSTARMTNMILRKKP